MTDQCCGNCEYSVETTGLSHYLRCNNAEMIANNGTPLIISPNDSCNRYKPKEVKDDRES